MAVRLEKYQKGNSLEVQWLGLTAFTAGAQVQSRVGGLRSPQALCGEKKKKKKSTRNMFCVSVFLNGALFNRLFSKFYFQAFGKQYK